MRFVITPYAIAHALNTLVSLAVMILAWRRRRAPGVRSFTLLMAAVVIWSLGIAFESAAVGVPAKLLFSKLAYIGTVSVAPLFLLFALQYSGWKRPPALAAAALWFIPAVTMALAATNERHGLVWSSITPSPVPGANLVIYGHGPWFWISISYYFIVVLAASVLLVYAVLHRQRVFAWQTALMMAGVAIPWLSFVVYVTPLNPLPGLDTTPLGFSLTGILLLWAMSRHGLFDLVPVARDLLLERMNDGLVVLDERGRVVDLNLAARKLFGLDDSAIGKPAAQVLSDCPELARLSSSREEMQVETASLKDPARRFELRVSLLQHRSGQLAGRIVLLRDITARKLAEEERERLIKELQGALADIKTLRGLLPICSSCKKIRDDKGYWRQLEHYITEHSQAEFSHGLCPECLRKLYPDLADQVLGQP